jgi:hypothetical protein
LCRLTKRLTDGNHNPSVQTLNIGRATLMHLVTLGQGSGLTGEATIATPFPKVVFRPIAGDDERLLRRVGTRQRQYGPSAVPELGAPHGVRAATAFHSRIAVNLI